jgi:transcriptional regulator with XRE-family HTH domain
VTPEELLARRKTLALTQAALAEKLNVDLMTVSRWECGARAVPPFLHLALDQLAALKRRKRK